MLPRHRSFRKLHAPRSSVSRLVPEAERANSARGSPEVGRLEGPGEKEALCSLVASCTSGAPERRGVRAARASGGTCAGRAHGGGSTTGQRQKSERPSSCAQWRQLRHRWQPGAPRHKGWLWDVVATREPAKGKRKPRARPVTVLKAPRGTRASPRELARPSPVRRSHGHRPPGH